MKIKNPTIKIIKNKIKKLKIIFKNNNSNNTRIKMQSMKLLHNKEIRIKKILNK